MANRQADLWSQALNNIAQMLQQGKARKTDMARFRAQLEMTKMQMDAQKQQWDMQFEARQKQYDFQNKIAKDAADFAKMQYEQQRQDIEDQRAEEKHLAELMGERIKGQVKPDVIAGQKALGKGIEQPAGVSDVFSNLIQLVKNVPPAVRAMAQGATVQPYRDISEFGRKAGLSAEEMGLLGERIGWQPPTPYSLQELNQTGFNIGYSGSGDPWATYKSLVQSGRLKDNKEAQATFTAGVEQGRMRRRADEAALKPRVYGGGGGGGGALPLTELPTAPEEPANTPEQQYKIDRDRLVRAGEVSKEALATVADSIVNSYLENYTAGNATKDEIVNIAALFGYTFTGKQSVGEILETLREHLKKVGRFRKPVKAEEPIEPVTFPKVELGSHHGRWY